ncbi:hypothetical protein MTR67_030949, partial [Solanum verrucosum]
DMDSEAPTLESVLIVNEVSKVFPNNLPGVPPKREIDLALKVKEQGKDIIGQKEVKKLKKSKTDAHQSHSTNYRVALQLAKSYSRLAHGQSKLGEETGVRRHAD